MHPPADRLDPQDILSRLPDRRWIREVLVLDRTSSTNDFVTAQARQGAPAGLAVFAEEQTAGRGRLGRRWQSDPHAGLWFSILIRPEFPLLQWPRLTLWLAFAVAQAIQRHISLKVALKWPNDIYASGRKLAGILVETSSGDNPFATAGIGLNVNQSSFPASLDTTATSLCIETGSPIDRSSLAATILASIDESFSLLPSHFHTILAWASRTDCLRGQWVATTVGGAIHRGVAEGLDPEGALLIRPTSGPVIRLNSGEVTRCSPTPPP
ncbi:MAG: biotin--[acetyl-CoA-carboxylase] ligase [Chthoniobacteraceae bacterium]